MLGKLHLGTLRTLGFDAKLAADLKASIDKAAGEKIDPYNYVPLGVVKAHAAKLGVDAGLIGRLDGALRTAGTAPIRTKTDLAAFPKPAISTSAPKALPAAAGALEARSLAPYRASLDALFEKLGRKELVGATPPAAELQAILQEHAPKLRALPTRETGLTGPQIEKLLGVVASSLAPAHTERDLAVRLDSILTPLHAAGGVKVLLENRWEGFSVKRTAHDEVNLHAVKSDRILVALPKGHTAMFVDADGNERAAGLPKRKQSIDGESVEVVELSRTLVEPGSSKGRVFDPSFTLKVFDPAGNAVYEQAFAFDKVPSWTSEELGRFRFGRPPLEGEVAVLDHAVPAGSTRDVPLGRRPAFEHADGACDRLVIQRDGQSFAVDDLLQLLRPPKGKTQAFSGGEGKRRYLLADDARIARPLDDGAVRPAVSLGSSVNERFSFDPSLSQMPQARLGFEGLTVFGADGRPVARFDPFDPAADLNARK